MSEKWFQSVIDQPVEEQRRQGLEAFSIVRATDKQEAAIRGFATAAGFKDLRGFWSWTRSAGLNYYDLIKVASPE